VAEPAPTPRTETGTAPAISLTGVTRVFGSQPAIVGVRLVVGRGEVVLLRGANGAGKSTLLRVLAVVGRVTLEDVGLLDGESRRAPMEPFPGEDRPRKLPMAAVRGLELDIRSERSR
jgi:ABC-type Fe3+/spermidine/putrescine transport system ATPase subunit